MVVIRLARSGRKGSPVYKIMVQDKNAKLKGRFLEKIGTYRPSKTSEYFVLDTARYDEWLKLGAIPSPRMAKVFKDFLKKNPATKDAAAPAATDKTKTAKVALAAAPAKKKTAEKPSAGEKPAAKSTKGK